MQLIILHGYLLQGTGSNIYVANIAKAWRKQGHAVTVVCQDRTAEALPFVEEFIEPIELVSNIGFQIFGGVKIFKSYRCLHTENLLYKCQRDLCAPPSKAV